MKGIFKNINPNINIITDSTPAIDWLKQNHFKTRPKFIGLRPEKLKEEIQDRSINIFKIKGENNIADPLTKETTWGNFFRLINVLKNDVKLGMCFLWLNKESSMALSKIGFTHESL